MKSPSARLRIVLGGYIVGGPLGGLVWHHLQYVLGFHKMGHDVIFIEDSNDYLSCYDPKKDQISNDPAYGLRFIANVFSCFSISDKWAYYNAHTDQWFGMTREKIKAFCDTADVFLNLSGITPIREFLQKIPVRIFVDTDPVFTQIRHLTDAFAMESAKKHNQFFSFGENFGNNSCSIPDDQFAWQPTRQPVVMELWQSPYGNKNNPWTTVMQWDSYKIREYNGRTFGMKSASFDPYIKLPQLTSDRFELAIGSDTASKEKLLQGGWQLRNPLLITETPESYQNYIESSKGEWSIAKHGYVSSCSGWFSERSTCYLASGRPVIVQDTGFSDFFETGRGLLSFNNPDEALDCIETVNRNYTKHCEAASSIALEYFDHKKVLGQLLDRSFIQKSRKDYFHRT